MLPIHIHNQFGLLPFHSFHDWSQTRGSKELCVARGSRIMAKCVTTHVDLFSYLIIILSPENPSWILYTFLKRDINRLYKPKFSLFIK